MNSNLGNPKFFVIYQITNLIDNRIYVGCHITYNVNDKYMGSSKSLKKDIKEQGRQNFKKEILHVFDNKKDMMNKEAEIVNREFCHRLDTYNLMVGGINEYTTEGMVSVKDSEGNTSKVYLDDPRYISGELVGVTKGTSHPNRSLANKGKLVAKDEFGEMHKISLDDSRYLSGELIHVTKGLPGTKSFEGKNHSEETKQKMSEKASDRTGEKNSMFGKQRTKEFKDEMKKKLSNYFFVYDLEGNFISKENNAKDFAEVNNLNLSTVQKAIRGDYKRAGNFMLRKEVIDI